jgi:catechol 2,3-dioxygenase-like lactoylglutathione lyase family enzyme
MTSVARRGLRVVTLAHRLDAITLFVDDHRRSRAFYERVFASPPIYEDDDAVTFRLENAMLNLLRRPAAHELVAPAAVGSGDAGAAFQLTLAVEDADAASAALTSRGIELLNGPVDRPWGVRTAAFADPDGHVWELAQALPG